jgi:ABC-2 type transport system ATP-binding protein
MNRLLDVRDVSRRFGKLVAVDGVTFAVERGEVVGFLGPNGAGKSTTMKMITGYLAPSAGSISVAGFDVVQRPTATKRAIGYLPEGAPLYGDMTPEAFLGFVADVRGLLGTRRRERLAAVVDRLQLAEVLRQPIETLSKGFKRRVGLAAAIAHDPDLLILDEPTDGLDPNQKHEVRALLRELAPDKAILISTHILEEVEAVCARAIVVARGRIVADATPEALLAQAPNHNAVALRVGARDLPAVLELFETLDGVARVETRNGPNGAAEVLAFPTDGRDLTAEARRAATARGVKLRGLHVERGRLDDVFRELTRAA